MGLKEPVEQNLSIKQYCCIYLKHYGSIIFFCGTMVFLALLVEALIYDVLKYDLLVAFLLPYGLSALIFIPFVMWTVRFRWMIRNQEQHYGVRFSDETGAAASRDKLEYLSENWYIHAGSAAFYSRHIEGISFRRQVSGSGESGYNLYIRTADGRRYRLYVMTGAACKRIKSWWENRRMENVL